jgi:hypothetical protein
MANSGRSYRSRMLDAMEAVVECDSEDDRAWEAAWRRLHYAARRWLGSNPQPRRRWRKRRARRSETSGVGQGSRG